MITNALKSIGVSKFKEEAFPYISALWNTALWLTKRRSDAENLTAKTMLLAYDSWHDVADHSGPKARLFRTMFSEFLNSLPGAYRPKKYLREHRGPAEPAAGGNREDKYTSINSSEMGLLTDIPDMYVRAAIARLRPVPRLIMVLHFGERFSCDDIAHITGLPTVSVRSILHKARRFIPGYLVRNGGRPADAGDRCDGHPRQEKQVGQTHGLGLQRRFHPYDQLFAANAATDQWENEGGALRDQLQG